ncbi:MAG: glycosyltransferase family 39 protein [bacterium]
MEKNKLVLLTCLMIFALAFGIRLLNLEIIKDNPFFKYPIMDEKYHDEWAQEVAGGKVFDRVPYYRAPAYSYFLGLVYAVFGHDYYIPRLFGILMGALSCIIIYLIGDELFSRRVGILAGLLACVYSMFIYFDSLLLSVHLEIFFSVLATLFLVKWLKTQINVLLIIAGLFWGLASITRPTFLICILVFAAYLFVIAHKEKLKERLKRPILLIVGALPIIASVMIINLTIGKDNVPLAWNGGINFYLGNNPAANGWSATSPEIKKTWLGGYNDAIIIAENDMHKNLRPSAVSIYWFRKGLRYILSRPIDWSVLMLKKIYLLISSYELPNNQSIKTYRSFSFLLRIPLLSFGLVIVLAAVGLFTSPGTRSIRIIQLFLISYALSIVLFFVPARYRMPLIPMLLIFAAYAVFWFIQEAKAKKFKRVALVSGMVLLGLVFVHTDLLAQHGDLIDKSIIHATYANHYFDQEQYNEALVEYNLALGHDPENIKTMNALGDTYYKLGQYNEARRVFSKSLSTQNNADARFKLGLINFDQNILDSAQLYFSGAVALDSTNPTTYYYAGMSYAIDKKPQQAIQYLELSLRFHPYPRYISNTHRNIGLSYLEIGNINKAKEHFIKSGMNQQDIYNLIR